MYDQVFIAAHGNDERRGSTKGKVAVEDFKKLKIGFLLDADNLNGRSFFWYGAQFGPYSDKQCTTENEKGEYEKSCKGQ